MEKEHIIVITVYIIVIIMIIKDEALLKHYNKIILIGFMIWCFFVFTILEKYLTAFTRLFQN